MKTQESIKAELNIINNQMYSAKKEKNQKSLTQLRKEKEHLEFLLRYLQTNPTEEQIKRMLNSVTHEITTKDKRFDEWRNNNRMKFSNNFAAKSHYEKINDLPRLRTQQKTLEYLLS